MKVQMRVDYYDVGIYELDSLSDKTLGALTRGMLQQATDKADVREVTWKTAKKDENGDELPF